MSFEQIDLAATPRQMLDVDADFCIIGAGAAGIYVAVLLVKAGRSVVIVEAGPKHTVDSRSLGFDALFGADPYSGASSGRFFGLGGTTARWGGALVPHTDLDFRPLEPSAEAWAKIIRTVGQNTTEVLHALGCQRGVEFEAFAEKTLGQAARVLFNSGLRVQSGLCLPFRRKNMVGLLKQLGRGKGKLRVFFNAVAKSFQALPCEGNLARIRQLVTVSRNLSELRINARRFVICAGAIESARILLEMQEAAPEHILRKTAAPGRYLGDHLSITIADVTQDSLDKAAALFAPRFCGGWMRNFRLLNAESCQDHPRSFAHFIFANNSRGFVLAKTLLGAMQQRRRVHLAAGDVVSGIGDLTRLGIDRLVASRLHIPAGTPTHLQLDMEQTPSRMNRVILTDNQDEYGRRVARIDWRVSERDVSALAKIANRYLTKWPGSRHGLPQLRPRQFVSSGERGREKPNDAYHPVGTCRMGSDPEAVVDDNLRVWGLENLWLVSTGVLPSAGTANPTFTMLCLAHRLAEKLQSLR